MILMVSVHDHLVPLFLGLLAGRAWWNETAYFMVAGKQKKRDRKVEKD
jgi:hypothetical protein